MGGEQPSKDMLLMNQSLGQTGFNFNNKVKPRDFNIQASMLKRIGAENYD